MKPSLIIFLVFFFIHHMKASWPLCKEVANYSGGSVEQSQNPPGGLIITTGVPVTTLASRNLARKIHLLQGDMGQNKSFEETYNEVVKGAFDDLVPKLIKQYF